jgi:hypothetical protein
MAAESIKSTPASPVLTGIESPPTDDSSSRFTYERLDMALVRQEDIESLSLCRELWSSQSNTQQGTTSTASVPPSVFSPFSEEDVEAIISRRERAVRKVESEIPGLANQAVNRIKALDDKMSDLSASTRELTEMVKSQNESLRETNQYLEECQRKFAEGMAGLKARRAERKRREAQERQDLNRRT